MSQRPAANILPPPPPPRPIASDKEKLLQLLKEFGITNYNLVRNDVEITAKCCEKVVGYNDFVTAFNFDKDGRFVQMGIWE